MSKTTAVMQWQVSHTAGHDMHGQSAVYDEVDGKDIAIVYDGDAHARLIAAAPEMLEALEYFVNEATSSHPMEFVSIDRALKFAQLTESAIRKARGE